MSGNKPLTIVFVDYESIFWGLYSKGESPNVDLLIEDVKKRSKLIDVYFFADFTKSQFEKERNKLRKISNNIIDCTNNETAKDFTDFIMLDHIYKTLIGKPEIEQYILVTGDGHFHSVASYLRTFHDKTVGVYAVQGTLSEQLKECAGWYEEITVEQDLREYIPKILQTIKLAEEKGIVPSFNKSVEVCSQYYRVDQGKLAAALSKLINDGYVVQRETTLPTGQKVMGVFPKWELLESAFFSHT